LEASDPDFTGLSREVIGAIALPAHGEVSGKSLTELFPLLRCEILPINEEVHQGPISGVRRRFLKLQDGPAEVVFRNPTACPDRIEQGLVRGQRGTFREQVLLESFVLFGGKRR